MKKVISVFVMALVACTLFASPIQLGSFPIGQWLDHNYDAVWDFASNNIRILSPDGKVIYDFSARTVQDFNVLLEGLRPGISFSCPEAERSYRFITTIPSSDLVLEIERKDLPKYSVTMKKQ